jgi:hypothetical protein
MGAMSWNGKQHETQDDRARRKALEESLTMTATAATMMMIETSSSVSSEKGAAMRPGALIL